MTDLITLQPDFTRAAAADAQTRTKHNGNGPSVYIRTYGCQMNVSDTQTIESMLGEAGYNFVDSPDIADIVLVNTCMIRETAEVRALGQLADLGSLKKQNPHKVIGILGCVAQAKRKEILQAQPYVDIVIGPDSYRRLSILLEERLISPPGTPGLLETTLLREELYDDIVPKHNGGPAAFVTIIRGCDKFCSFCVVPRTRGRERSRPLASIVREVQHLSDQGVKDVTLLGQNVDSYRWEDKDFADCLKEVAAVSGITRVRFMTSHPTDITEKLLDTMGNTEKICPFLHLPVQAGNNRVLEAMNRHYTREKYLKIIQSARRKVPNIALSTDVIVGFPTETEAEFADTMSLFEEVRYDSAFMFKYSSRPLTKAERMTDTVSEEIKTERLTRLIDRQQEISREQNQAQLGRKTTIMIEGISPKNEKMWMGRTPDFRPVVIPVNGDRIGDEISVKLVDLKGFTFQGQRLN